MASSKDGKIRRMASMAAEYDKEETGTKAPVARSPRSEKPRQKPIDETDGEPVRRPTPVIERRNLRKCDQTTRDLISVYWEEVAAEQSKKVFNCQVALCIRSDCIVSMAASGTRICVHPSGLQYLQGTCRCEGGRVCQPPLS